MELADDRRVDIIALGMERRVPCSALLGRLLRPPSLRVFDSGDLGVVQVGEQLHEPASPLDRLSVPFDLDF